MSIAPAIGDYESLFVRFQENEQLRADAAEVGLQAGSPFIFVCECGEFSCVERVRLTLTEFDQRRRTHAAVVAHEHRGWASALAVAS